MQIDRHTAGGWWLEEAGGVDPRPPLEEQIEVDVVVIGGGYTGMWTAWHLLERQPGARVAILESDLCGHGPSGRNGGFCESLWLSAAKLREQHGSGPALDLLEASSATVAAVGDWCRSEGVDAWFDQSGYICASTTPAHDHVGRESARAAAELGRPDAVVELGAAEVRERCDSPAFRRGVLIPDFATLHPARLALGLRRRLIERGALIFERSRVRALHAGGQEERSGGGVQVETARGAVRAAAAVLAVGGAARAIRPLRSKLSVASSHIVLTEPVPELIDELRWTGGECFTDGRTLVHYFRTTRDGRILFGWGGGRLAAGARLHGRCELDPEVVGAIEPSLLRIFPGLAGRRIEHAWGGPIDVSPTHIPQIGTVPGAPVHFAFGYTGNGVGPTHLAGRVLASLAMGVEDDGTRLPIVGAPAGAWVPPEPFAWTGGRLVRAALVRQEQAQDENRRPDPLTRAATAIPRMLGIHMAR